MRSFLNIFNRKKNTSSPKVIVLGIDGAPPHLILDEWLDDLPNIKSLLSHSIYGKMESSVPPSTIVAWTSFLTGKDPSFFDVYSYTYKDDHNQQRLSNSRSVKEKRIWDYLDHLKKRSILVNVPLTYPITSLDGIMIGGFLSPDLNDSSVFPPAVRKMIEKRYGKEYLFDVGSGLAGYKNLPPAEMLSKAKAMTDQQLTLLKKFVQDEKWDFAMAVMLGSDRIQHTMWKYHDPKHRRYPGPNEYQNSLKEYYQYLDAEIASIKEMLDDNTYLIIASDHGFTRMDGRINLNDWLIREGYLVLKEAPSEQQKLDFKNVDWSKTRAYAVGAYFGRIYFNRKQRDPLNGIIEEADVPVLQKEIYEKIRNIADDQGQPLRVLPFFPQDIYKGPYRDNGPDLYLYFDDLKWGVNNDVGNEGLHNLATTKGSDDAGHAPYGMFILHHRSLESRRDDDIKLIDVLPTMFKIMEVPIPPGLSGRILI
ncbi:hypothetical protein COV20_03855 [Candidatus Woesearchaeota archaeon CG10_big_fil_rev_8_21_14_0_10_45_16]|nr:MAG: hypothetical protein COV20_03855 [Candidatus Woesearchaeota archaeon CG10_big_fil_rev_8_21_14_0_10_45_16]